MEGSDRVDYASSGVDIDLEGSAVSSLVGALGSSVRKPGEIGAPVKLPGGFGGLIEFGESLLALATDGVGSKLQLASELEQWGGVGIDCMAMNVNDLLCVGAEPIAFVDYIAVPKPDPVTHAAIGESLTRACEQARVTLAGGETASLPGIVTELDLSGTALGWLPKGAAITGAQIQPGDVLIGLPSSGIHSNGYSLVRKIIEISGADLNAAAPFDTTHPNREIYRFNNVETVSLGEVLLNPTRIYVNPVTDLITACKSGEGPAHFSAIRGIAHITGGGLSNLLRLHDSLGFHIDSPLPIPPEFHWIDQIGNVGAKEMHRTFNMGMGMVLVVSETSVVDILTWLDGRMSGCAAVGEVRSGTHQVTHADSEVTFDYY